TIWPTSNPTGCVWSRVRAHPTSPNVMNDTAARRERPHSSRRRYRDFVQNYKLRQLDDPTDAKPVEKVANTPPAEAEDKSVVKPERRPRREYIRAYARWLLPHKYAVAVVFLLALFVAGMEMIEPLFMRFII